MNRKIVFFDLDGTVWDWFRNIEPSTIEAIARLRENGHLAYICSGRSKGHILPQSYEGITFDGIVAGCGTHIECNGKIVFEQILPPDLVKFTVDTLIECNLPSVLEGPVKHWISEHGFETDSFVDNMKLIMGENAVIFTEYTPDIVINKFSSDILKKTDYDTVKNRLKPYYNFIEHEFSPDSSDDLGTGDDRIIGILEAVPNGFTKGTGIIRTCEYLGIDPADTFAIGDSANDIDMFKNVRHSICMGNGTSVAKDAAEYVTTKINDNGIYNALKHYGLI